MQSRLHVYTGDGKGKTTAAMGLALRALGHERSVLVAQFMKDGRSGELAALRSFEKCNVVDSQPVSGFVFRMSPEEKERTRQEQTEMARRLAQQILRERPQMVVLDELAVALNCEIVEKEAAEALIDAALACGETVVTGRNAPQWLQERADYVSLIAACKHPYHTEQLPAREGVEW